MCTMAAVPLALMAVSAVVDYSRGEAEIKTREAEAENQARYQEYQAQLRRREADKAAYDGRKAMRELNRRQAAERGKSLLAQGSSGAEMGDGSALDVLLDQASAGAEEATELNRRTRDDVRNLQYGASIMNTNAKNTREAGKDRRTLLERGLNISNHFVPVATAMYK